jgi:hypothetical protein
MRLSMRSLLLFSTALSILIMSELPAPVARASEAGSVPPLPPVPQSDPFFGIVQSIHDPFHAANAGARWERLVLWWSNIQPQGPGDWKSDGWFPRNLIQDDKNRGIDPVAVVLHTPNWAATDPAAGPTSSPRNLQLPFDDPNNTWGQFLTRIAGEYAGLIDTWILWNEPDIYGQSGGNWSGTVEDFARMQMVGYQAIKRANPQAKVVLAGTTYWWDLEHQRPQYLDRVLTALQSLPGAAENGAYFDAVSVHQYSNPLNCFTVPTLYQRILQQHQLNKPIWLDEANVPPYDDPLHPLQRGGLRASLEEQSNYVIQCAALARAAGVERFAVYKMRDEEPENQQYYGLVRNDGTPRPAYVAYQVAARELANATDPVYFWSGSATPPSTDEITGLLASTASRPQFVWPGSLNGVRMKRGSDRVTVLWNVSAAPLEIGIPSSGLAATAIDKYGGSQTLARGVDGAFRLTLAPATNNSDARDASLVLVGGDPLILVEPGAAGAPDALPRPIDVCWGVPGSLLQPDPSPQEAWVAPTGYVVSGPWLDFFRSHGDIDYIGNPRSPVVADPLDAGQCIQYFQRVVLEWHPQNPAEYRIQRRLLATEMSKNEAAPPETAAKANGNDYWFFPLGDRGLGHAVSNYAADGSWIGFKSYFDVHGREDAFGYPMEAPAKLRGEDGVERWTQRFQAAVFEYHAEFDREGVKPGANVPWRTWIVQLRLLGDRYLEDHRLPFIAGDPAAHLPVPPDPTP